MANKKTQTYVLLGLLVLLLVAAAYFGGLFSIAVPVGLAKESGYSTPQQALAACEQFRIKYQGQGQTCDPCGLACPSSARDGTYSYSNINGNFSVTFDPSLCSSQYTASGNLLEAKSFCHDTIRLCEVQSGTGSITQVTQVKNGHINTIKYSYYLTECSTGKYVGTSTLTSTKYQLECNSGFMVDGTRTASSASNLGSCVTIPAEGTQGPSTKGATLRNVVISTPVQSGKSLRISGVADITGLDGNYYIHGALAQPPANTFSVITGFGFQDECGNDPLAATLIKGVKQGDQLVFQLDIVAPSLEGGKSVQSGYTVTVLDRCGGEKLATASGTYELVPKPVPVTTPVIIPIGVEPPIDPTVVADEQASVEGNTCAAGEEAIIQDCVVAKCNSAGLMEAIDPIICNGTEYPSGSTTVDENGGVVGDTTQQQNLSLWERFVAWFKRFFRLG